MGTYEYLQRLPKFYRARVIRSQQQLPLLSRITFRGWIEQQQARRGEIANKVGKASLTLNWRACYESSYAGCAY